MRVTSWISKILFVLYSLQVGLFLLCLPWFHFWENNQLLYAYPQLRPLISNSYFKGAVLGLGIANVLIAIHEIVHFRNASKSFFE
jgi:hypothetical protein